MWLLIKLNNLKNLHFKAVSGNESKKVEIILPKILYLQKKSFNFFFLRNIQHVKP